MVEQLEFFLSMVKFHLLTNVAVNEHTPLDIMSASMNDFGGGSTLLSG
jgi:hypothetical protein